MSGATRGACYLSDLASGEGDEAYCDYLLTGDTVALTKTKEVTYGNATLCSGALPIAKALKADGETQATIAEWLGVDRTTVAKWLDKKRTNVTDHNSSPLPDCRVKIPAKAKPAIVAAIKGGAKTRDVAAKLKVTQRQVQKIVADADKKEAQREKERAAVVKASHDWNVVAKQDVVECNALITDPPYGILYRCDECGHQRESDYPPELLHRRCGAPPTPRQRAERDVAELVTRGVATRSLDEINATLNKCFRSRSPRPDATAGHLGTIHGSADGGPQRGFGGVGTPGAKR